jgi:thiol-disulfide isomerase/thioredoxin
VHGVPAAAPSHPGRTSHRRDHRRGGSRTFAIVHARPASTFALACSLVAIACGAAAEVSQPPEDAPPAAPDDEGDRIGHPATPFEVEGWIVDGEPAAPDAITLADLAGRVVVVRFWTDTCPYCRATAPALAELDRDFGPRGVVVLGLHHPKPRPDPSTPIDLDAESRRVAAIAEQMGLTFPIGLDRTWRTLDAWWLSHRSRAATSATFVLDRRGIIRWIHPGPEFHPGGPEDHAQCRADYARLRETITALLDEDAA